MTHRVAHKLAVLNLQTVVPDTLVQAWVRALEIQINRDVSRTWGVEADVVYVPRAKNPPSGYWVIVVVNDADMANALGYHDITSTGLPLGKVFVKTALQYHEDPSVTLSHEALEMLGDPFVSLVVVDPWDARKYWARELCDAVQDDALGYDIVLPATSTRASRTVRVSDFQLPSYFNAFWKERPFSFCDNLAGSLPTLAPGGWMAYIYNGVWGQATNFAELSSLPRTRQTVLQLKSRLDGPLDRRRIQRMIPKDQWVRSTHDVQSS